MSSLHYASLFHPSSAGDAVAAPSPAVAYWHKAICSKKLWLRVNRTLAWALVVSPVVQIALGSALVPGLLLDLAILLMHGALSVWLFGLPKASEKVDTAWIRWIGTPHEGLSPRQQFLLSGWRVVLGTGYQLVLYALIACMVLWSAWYSLIPGEVIAFFAVPVSLGILVASAYFGLILPYAIVTHLYRASRYGLARFGAGWGVGIGWRSRIAGIACSALVVAFLLSSFYNLFR
jgi:hypothetical protein